MDNERVLLVDADMICFRACSACEREIDWGDDIWTLHVDLAEAIAYLQDRMDMYIKQALELDGFEGGKIKVIYCFSASDNFRKKLLGTYKLNRVGKRKPVAYWALKKWVVDNCETAEAPHLEADDVMGILATGMYKDKSIIISGDKDMRSVPTKMYNFINGQLTITIPADSFRFHMYQTLVGDTADNYQGCPKVGGVKANKLFNDFGCSWNTVVTAFKNAGLTAEDALVQARVSYILQKHDYIGKKVRLWDPPSSE